MKKDLQIIKLFYMSRSDVVTVDEILRLTDGGYDVFKYELGNIPSGNISSPLRTGDNDPSFGVYNYRGVWFFKDQGGSQDAGTAIQFVQKRYNLNFVEALNKIAADLGIKERRLNYKAYVKIDKPHEKIYKQIDADFCPFDKFHAAYWDKIHLPEDFLKKNNIYRVKKWAVDKKIQEKMDGELTFAYYAPDIDRFKILRINVPSELKWKTSVPNKYLWSYYEYKDSPVEDLFVIKSRKDEMVMRYLGYDTVSVQSEASRTFLENNVSKVAKISTNPIILMGTDPQGKKTSQIITQATGWKWFNIKNDLYEKYDIEDPAAFVEAFNMKQLDNLIKIKGFKNGKINLLQKTD